MIRLTDEELDKIDTTGIYDYFKECEKRECIAGNSREAGFNCDGRYLSACEYHKRTVAEEKALIAKAQLKKDADTIESMVADGWFLEDIVKAMRKEEWL